MGWCLNCGLNALVRQSKLVVEILDGPALNKCNDAAIEMAWRAVTPKFDDWKNPFGGIYRKWKPGDLIDLYFHEDSNWEHFQLTRQLPLCHGQPHDGKYPPEQIPQYHQLALREIFNLGSDFSFKASFSYIAGEVDKGVSCILRIKSPGHFVLANGYDEKTQRISFKDPAPIKWLIETEDAAGNKYMTADDFKSNIHSDVTRAWRL